MKKRILSLLLALCLVAGMLPTVAYAYDNSGTIDSGEFTEDIDNFGTIYGGLFNGAIINYSIGDIYGGVFNRTVNNVGGGHIHNGIFNSTVNNANSIIHGGTFNGAVTNDGGQISGGIFYGAVANEGDIETGTFYGTVSGSGTIRDSAKVTVTFDSDGGSSVTEQKVLKGQKASAPTNPTKEDCTFVGWYNGDIEFDFANTPVTENITLTAKWSIVWTELTQDSIETYKSYSSAEGTNIYDLPSGNYYLGEDISVDITVYIGDRINAADVTLDLNGHTLRMNTEYTPLLHLVTSESGSATTLTLIDSSSAKTGTVSNKTGFAIVILSDCTLNANGGTVDGLVVLQSFSFEHSAVINNTDSSNVTIFTGEVTCANASIIRGGIFNGTVRDNGKIEGGTFYGTVSSSVTISDSAKVTVAFDSDGSSTVDEQKVLRGQKATEPADPTKEDCTFVGWYNGDDPYDFDTSVTENITLTAKWSEKSDITFSTTPQSYTYDGTAQAFSITGTSVTGFDISYKQKGQTVTNPTDAGSYDVIITRAEDDTYKAVDVTITNGLVINPKPVIIQWNNTENLVYDGSPKTISAEVLNKCGNDSVTVTTSGDLTKTDKGTYTASVTSVDNPNYTLSGGQNLEKEWSIAQATNSFTTALSIENWTYGDTPNIPQGASKFGDVVFTYSDSENGTYTSTPPTNAGTYWVKANVIGTENYTELEAKKQFSIIPKPITAVISSIPDATYTGSDIEPVVTVYDGQTVIPASEYTVSYSDNRNAGTATVTLTDKAGGNYVVSGTTTFEILPKSISDAVITLNGALTYNGTEQTQNVTVTLAGFDTVTVDVSGNKQTDVNTNGDYTLTVTGNGNFTGSKNLDWNIAPATPTENPEKKTTARVVRGRTLADAAVTNGEILGVAGTTALSGTFTWVDSTKIMSADGTEQMTFTPDDTNYTPITIDVAVSTYTTGGGGPSIPTYAPTVTQPENGSVTVSPKAPKKGDTVTVTTTPVKGYTVEQILVTDKNGAPVEVTNNGDGTYSFTQPAGKVDINVTFMEDNTMLNFFVDVPADAYYYDAVLWAVENGITDGTSDTAFSPNAPCTRAQIVTFLWRAAGCPEPESMSSLSDVPADAYYAKAVAWALENGITTGSGNGTFSPNATCTRAQAMTFIYRSEQAQGGGMQGEWMFQNPFSDVDLENYYGEAVMWAVANGVTTGTSDTAFSPSADCTRAQIVTFLFRYLVE